MASKPLTWTGITLTLVFLIPLLLTTWFPLGYVAATTLLYGCIGATVWLTFGALLEHEQLHS